MSEGDPRVVVTVATYNEMENLPELIQQIRQALPQVHVLVVDDNSPDGTGRWCEEEAQQHSWLSVIIRSGKLGLGTATIAALRWAVEHDYDLVVNMDADFSHPPQRLPALVSRAWDPEDPVDVVIGSRYVPEGRIEGWPWHRRWMSRAINTYARWLLGLKVRDCSGAFRCYRTSLLRHLDWEIIRSRGYSFQEEILFHLARLGARMAEVPITFVDRQRGQSKINLREALAALWILFTLGLGRLFHRRGIPGQEVAAGK